MFWYFLFISNNLWYTRAQIRRLAFKPLVLTVSQITQLSSRPKPTALGSRPRTGTHLPKSIFYLYTRSWPDCFISSRTKRHMMGGHAKHFLSHRRKLRSSGIHSTKIVFVIAYEMSSLNSRNASSASTMKYRQLSTHIIRVNSIIALLRGNKRPCEKSSQLLGRDLYHVYLIITCK